MPPLADSRFEREALVNHAKFASDAASVNLTRKMLLPLRGGLGSELSSALARDVLIADAAPAPGGGGTNEPNAD